MTPALQSHYLTQYRRDLNRGFEAQAQAQNTPACRDINRILVELSAVQIRLALEEIKCK